MMFRHSRLSLLLPPVTLCRDLARLLCFPGNVILYKYMGILYPVYNINDYILI